jgi:hypothetical protein
MFTSPSYARNIIGNIETEHAVVGIKAVMHLTMRVVIGAQDIYSATRSDIASDEIGNYLARCLRKFDLEAVISSK